MDNSDDSCCSHPSDKCSGSKTSSSRIRGNVSFSSVKIREYEVILGDNPSCSSGPPLSLGWKYDDNNRTEMPLDDYEDYRVHTRRTRYQMRIPSYTRYDILKQWNFSRLEITQVQKELRVIQIRRYRSMKAAIRMDIIKNLLCRQLREISPLAGREGINEKVVRMDKVEVIPS